MALAALLAAVVLSATAGSEIVVTRDSGTLPSGCTPREAAELLVRFADAVNAGDAKALKRIFPLEDGDHFVWRPEPYFRWYSVNDVAIFDLVDLFPYLAERHRRNERWQVVGVDVGGRHDLMPTAGISFVIRRGADDLPPGLSRFAGGKGEIDCVAQRIFVWSMGQNAEDSVPTCPLPAGWAPGSAIVACSRTGEITVQRTGPSARAMLPDFQVVSSRARLPRPCAPRAVTARLRSALTAFNAGKGAAFARHFASGRAARARFAEQAYAHGVGWTAKTLAAPSRRPQRLAAAYRLQLVLTVPGMSLGMARSTLAVDCRSGLIRTWSPPRPTRS